MLNVIGAFESHLNLLDNNSNIPSQKAISNKVSENIRSIISSLYLRKLNKNNLQTTNFSICNQCGVAITTQMKPDSFTLPCKHTVCSVSCLSKLQKLSKLKSSNIACLECSSEIPSSYLTDLPIIIKKECEICLALFTKSELIKLGCGHQFNLNCIKTHIEYLILNFGVSDFKVGCPKCEIPIEEVYIKGILDKKKFDKYKMIILKNLVKDDEGPLAISNEDCGELDEFHVLHLDLLLDCGFCKSKDCVCCNFLATKREKQIDEEFQRAVQNYGFKTCPNCKFVCEKIVGCKFMKCLSPICKGLINFCYICAKSLTEAQHYSHYKAKGPFGEICNTIDGTPE